MVTARNHHALLFMSGLIPVVRRFSRRVRKAVARAFRALLRRGRIRLLRNASALDSIARVLTRAVILAIFLRGVYAK